MAEDIRFSKKAATLTHDSKRGHIKRNAGNFTRGSQLFNHELKMIWAAVRMPLYTWFWTAVVIVSALGLFTFHEHEFQLVMMKILGELWSWVGPNPDKMANLTLPNGEVVQGRMIMVPYHPVVQTAWAKAVQISVSSILGAAFICVPLTIWFVDFSKRRGGEIMTEHHERGAIMVGRDVLKAEVTRHNWREHEKECAKHEPPLDPDKILEAPLIERERAGLHTPYRLAGVPYPWRLEQSHAMFIGTTGAGKTTELKKLVTQARARGHRCVIFDLTGTFVESFYDPDTDVILNPMDKRCQPWSIFNDCRNYAEFMSAATALVPSGHSASDDFWQQSARTLFVEMCMKLIKMGRPTNAALAYYLMQSDLKTIHAQLEGSVAGPMMSPSAAKMAESIRTTFIANGNVIRFLPAAANGQKGFSITDWMTTDVKEGSILFITSTHPDLTLNRPLLTLWMDLCVNALFKMGRTRNLRTWFLIDEVHALHRLPAIDHGLQTARAFGGAFVLGMHSFDKLEETYGENGATNLASLAGTKLILKTADPETSRRCSEFIGDRQVRIMDEAYSYGYNDNRDASTITPRSNVEELVMPVDISNLPSLHGFVKFPDGFPAARILLEWKDYPVKATGFDRVDDLHAAEYAPSAEEIAEMGGGDREGGREEEQLSVLADEAEIAVSDAEREAEALREELEGVVDPDREIDKQRLELKTEDPDQSDGRAGGAKQNGLGYVRPKKKDDGGHRKLARKDLEERAGKQQKGQIEKPNANRSGGQESQLERENRQGFGTEKKDRDDPSIDDDMDLGR